MTALFNKANFQIQPRDILLLRGLLDSRVATIHHLSTLYFEGRIEAARKRVQKLEAAGIMLKRPRKSTDAAVYFLTRKAFRILGECGVLLEYPNVGWANLEKRARVSELTLKHELEVMDVRSALTAAVGKCGHSVVEFATWPKLFQFMAWEPGIGDVLVKPDGFIRIQGQDGNGQFEDMFFLEVDRSTEEQQILASRASCYRDYYERGGLANRFGHPRSAFKRFPFVVLMTFKNAERRNNTAEQLLRIVPPIRNQVWLSTLSEVTSNPLGPIWVKPSGYAKITQGTLFDVDGTLESKEYRRRPEREELVEATIEKHCLLGKIIRCARDIRCAITAHVWQQRIQSVAQKNDPPVWAGHLRVSCLQAIARLVLPTTNQSVAYPV